MVRLAIIEDSGFLRTGLRVALEDRGDMDVVGEFPLGEEWAPRMEQLGVEVALLGMRSPGLGLSAAVCRQIRDNSPGARVLMLSPSPGEKEALTSILAGASGIISIDVPSSELVHAVQLVSNGGSYFEDGIAERVIGRLQGLGRPEEGSPGLAQLTGRERRIVTMLAEGRSNREIGEGLGLAPTTVRNILTRIRAKLGVTSRTRLVRFAYEHGLSGFTSDGPSLQQDCN